MCAVGVSPCILHSFVALSRVYSFCSCPIRRSPLSETRHSTPEMHGAPPASLTSNSSTVHGATLGRGTPKDAAALPPAARGRPVTNENPQNPRFASKSTVANSANSRKSKLGHSGLRDIQGSLTSICLSSREQRPKSAKYLNCVP